MPLQLGQELEVAAYSYCTWCQLWQLNYSQKTPFREGTCLWLANRCQLDRVLSCG